jgi:hypothetical protein
VASVQLPEESDQSHVLTDFPIVTSWSIRSAKSDKCSVAHLCPKVHERTFSFDGPTGPSRNERSVNLLVEAGIVKFNKFLLKSYISPRNSIDINCSRHLLHVSFMLSHASDGWIAPACNLSLLHTRTLLVH